MIASFPRSERMPMTTASLAGAAGLGVAGLMLAAVSTPSALAQGVPIID